MSDKEVEKLVTSINKYVYQQIKELNDGDLITVASNMGMYWLAQSLKLATDQHGFYKYLTTELFRYVTSEKGTEHASKFTDVLKDFVISEIDEYDGDDALKSMMFHLFFVSAFKDAYSRTDDKEEMVHMYMDFLKGLKNG